MRSRGGVDFFVKQLYHVHDMLSAQWTRQHRPTQPIHIPFAWVMSKVLRLLEEYPDGLTEAVVLTELMTHLHRRERLSIKRARAPTLEELLEENDAAVISATVVDYHEHSVALRLDQEDTASSDDSQPIAVKMFLHQRFRACIAALASLGASQHEPFGTGRRVVFTNAKLLERSYSKRDTATSALLPTAYLGLILAPQDRLLDGNALSFEQMEVLASQEVHVSDASASLLQELVVRATVVDIGAIRPCTTPYHIQRQVIMLADYASASQPNGAVRSHLLVLWDDQVALSRLFHVGDSITLLHPFVHLCSPDDVEMAAVFEEFSSQLRCAYYLEYGTATTVFVNPHQPARPVITTNTHTRVPQLGHHSEVAVSIPAPNSVGFAVYGHVARVRVSHGIPLLAAYFYAYYDPKTQGTVATAQRPSLNRAVVSKYYLVVLVELYDSMSKQILSVELTGTTAVAALRLRDGQSIYIEGLVSVDLAGNPSIRALRDESAQHKVLTQMQDERARFAFPNRAYASPVVALSSDWESIFGQQSDAFQASRLFVLNEIPGVIKTKLSTATGTVSATDSMISSLVANTITTKLTALVRIKLTVTKVGWLIPDTANPQRYRWDEACENGFSTMLAHRACRRPLEMAASQPETPQPCWKCSFCNEIFTGMDATVQIYCDLAVRIDDGTGVVHAICHGDVAQTLLSVAAESFAQLSLPGKRSVLRQALGKQHDAVVSRSPTRQIVLTERQLQQQVALELRLDQVQPVDAYATSHALLATLRHQPSD